MTPPDPGLFPLAWWLGARNPSGQMSVGDGRLSLVDLIGCAVFVLGRVTHAGYSTTCGRCSQR
jgi:hypothetical protein